MSYLEKLYADSITPKEYGLSISSDNLIQLLSKQIKEGKVTNLLMHTIIHQFYRSGNIKLLYSHLTNTFYIPDFKVNEEVYINESATYTWNYDVIKSKQAGYLMQRQGSNDYYFLGKIKEINIFEARPFTVEHIVKDSSYVDKVIQSTTLEGLIKIDLDL